MQTTTNEFSFILRPAKYGIGVFAAHPIAAETYLRLFHEGSEPMLMTTRKKEDVPELFRQFCVSGENDTLHCPQDMRCMEVGWHLNHSSTPNAYHKEERYFALRDIQADEEITIDYNTLNEPEHAKESYYKK